VLVGDGVSTTSAFVSITERLVDVHGGLGPVPLGGKLSGDAIDALKERIKGSMLRRQTETPYWERHPVTGFEYPV
jgi:hypothetical protein